MAYVKDLENMSQVSSAPFQMHLKSHPNFYLDVHHPSAQC